ncbi:hypothetical protein B0O80DRAFT_459829 [Mortierella sp. GBAus27b]|nr:hypothetical protein BGX31_002878 [Mortierella sp. GBA43]KAI8349574.1 hypothetical protein B0O80DRAFT_459829 [Mortierella sp. GBAus27b]
MSRATLLPLLFIAVLALFSQVQAQNVTTTIPEKPECASLTTLYKEWVAPCLKKGTPPNDADPAWKPCICLNGFYPLSSATEQCRLGPSGQPKITASGLDSLCQGYKGYVAAANQTANASLAPALAAATSSIQAATPSPTASPGASSNSSGSNTPSSAVSTSVSALLSLIAVVLATTVAL